MRGSLVYRKKEFREIAQQTEDILSEYVPMATVKAIILDYCGDGLEWIRECNAGRAENYQPLHLYLEDDEQDNIKAEREHAAAMRKRQRSVVEFFPPKGRKSSKFNVKLSVSLMGYVNPSILRPP